MVALAGSPLSICFTQKQSYMLKALAWNVRREGRTGAGRVVCFCGQAGLGQQTSQNANEKSVSRDEAVPLMMAHV